MSLLPHRGCPAIYLAVLVLVLALGGCGGGPEGPVLADGGSGAAVPEGARARSESLTRLGQTALLSGELETAATLFEQAAVIDGHNVRASLGLGDTLLAVGRGLDASQAFERALAQQPDLPEAHYGYARAMIAIRRPEAALDHLRALAESRPGDTATLNALGVAYDLLGQHEEATATYRKGLTIVPASVPLRNNLALSLALQEQFPEALEELRPIAEGPAATRRTRQNLALVYGLQGDLAAAERLGRVDLASGDLQNNLSFFATVRGMEDPVLQAAALAPTGELAWDERRPARRSGSRSRHVQGVGLPPPPVAPAAVVPPAAAPSPPPAGPRPLTPALGEVEAGATPVGGWFVNVGKFPDATAAVRQWQTLRAKHADALAGLGKLAGASDGPEPLLVGPLADEQAASKVCGALGADAASCQPVRL